MKVFDHLAESIYLFLKEENVLNETLPLGLYWCVFQATVKQIDSVY